MIKLLVAFKAGTGLPLSAHLRAMIGKGAAYSFSVKDPYETSVDYMAATPPPYWSWSSIESMVIRFKGGTNWLTDAGSIANMYFVYFNLLNYVIKYLKYAIATAQRHTYLRGEHREESIAVKFKDLLGNNKEFTLYTSMDLVTRARSLYGASIGRSANDIRDFLRGGDGPSKRSMQSDLYFNVRDFISGIAMHVLLPSLTIVYSSLPPGYKDDADRNYELNRKTIQYFEGEAGMVEDDELRKDLLDTVKGIGMIFSRYNQLTTQGLQQFRKDAKTLIERFSLGISTGLAKASGSELNRSFDANRLNAFSLVVEKRLHKTNLVKGFFATMPDVNGNVLAVLSTYLLGYQEELKEQLWGFYSEYLVDRFQFFDASRKIYFSEKDKLIVMEKAAKELAKKPTDRTKLTGDELKKFTDELENQRKKVEGLVKKTRDLLLSIPYYVDDEDVSASGRPDIDFLKGVFEDPRNTEPSGTQKDPAKYELNLQANGGYKNLIREIHEHEWNNYTIVEDPMSHSWDDFERTVFNICMSKLYGALRSYQLAHETEAG